MALTKKKSAAAAETATEAVVEKPEKKEEKKATPKKAAAAAKGVLKKAAAKKPAEKVEEIYLQSGGAEWNVSDCKEKAVAAYVAEGHRAASVKKLVIYLKPEEGKAYFVINDSMNGSIDL